MDESFDKMEIFEYLDNPNNMIRIIAAGETAWKAIDGITISDHHEVEGYSTEKFTNDSFRFDETTHAVIVVADSISSELQEFLNQAKNRGILTLLFSPAVPDKPIKCDALCVMPSVKFRRSVEIILEMVFNWQWRCMDFNDVDTVCRNAGQIRLYDESGDNLGQIMDNLLESIDFQESPSLIINVVINANLSKRFQELILPAISQFSDGLPETIDDLIWGVSLNDRVKTGMYNVIVIASERHHPDNII